MERVRTSSGWLWGLVAMIALVSFWPRRARVVQAAPVAVARVVVDVEVSVVEPSGIGFPGAQVVARYLEAWGAELVSVTGTSDGAGKLVFEGLRERAGGSRFVVGFEGRVGEGLEFRVGAVPERELILVWEPEVEVVSEPVPEVTPDPEVVLAQEVDVEVEPEPEVPVELVIPEVTAPEPAPEVAKMPVLEPLPVVVQKPKAEVIDIPAPGLPRGSLVGRVVLDVGIPFSELRFELDEVFPANGSLVGKRHGPLSPGPDGRFFFADVEPGLCALRISLFGSQRTLAWVDRLEVEPGAELADPRLASFDLTGRLGSIEAGLFDGFGRRLKLAVLAPLDKRSDELGQLRVQAPGQVARLYFDRKGAGGGLHLVASAPNFAAREVLVTAAELEAGGPLRFVLEPLRTASLELRLMGPLAEGVRMRAELGRIDGQLRPWDAAHHQGEFDRAGRLHLQPVEAGEFVVALEVWEAERWRKLDLRTPLEVPLFDAPPAQSELGDTIEDTEVLYLAFDPSDLD